MNFALHTWCIFMVACSWAAEFDQPEAKSGQNFISEYKEFMRRRIADIISGQNAPAVETSTARPGGVQPVISDGAEVTGRSASVSHAARIEIYVQLESLYKTSPVLLYVVPGTLISMRNVLTSALLIDVLKELATNFGMTLDCRVVLGDLGSDLVDGEQAITVSLSSIIYHPSYVRPDDAHLDELTKNNLAVIPLGSALMSSKNASPIPIEIVLPESLAGYSLDLVGWETSNFQAWLMSKASFTGDGCQPYAVDNGTMYFPNSEFTSCYSSNGCSITNASFSYTGAPVTTPVPNVSHLKKNALVSVNQLGDCSTKSAFGSSMSYSSHADFVCQYAAKCYYRGNAVGSRGTAWPVML